MANVKTEAVGAAKTTSPRKAGVGKRRNRFDRKGKDKSNFERSSSSCNTEILPGNDFEYHNKYPELMQSLLKYPWFHIQGTPLKVPNNKGTIDIGNVITAQFLMTPGVCADPTDAYNLTSRDQWLELHRKYRGIGTYQQADYGITRLCIISLMVQILDAQRLFGIMHGYPVVNRVNPEGLLRAMGYTTTFIKSLKENLSDYRSRLNRIIVKARRLCLPNDLAVTKLWGGLASFVYKDSKNERACYLAFTPAGFWQYNATDMKTGTAAKFVQYKTSSYASCFALLDAVEANLDIMLTDDDVSRMCSDTIAAYGLESMEAIKEFPEDYTVDAVYDESILIKFHNCVGRFGIASNTQFVSIYDDSLIVTEKYDKGAMYIYQNDNNIIFNPVIIEPTGGTKVYDVAGSSTIHVTGPATPRSNYVTQSVHDAPLLDTWEDIPSDATRCEALLWKNTFGVYIANAASQAYSIGSKPGFFGTEIIGNIQVHNVAGGDVVSEALIECFYTGSGAAVDDSGYNLLSQFDWAPFVYIVGEAADMDTTFISVIGDLDNYTIVDVSSVAPAIFDCSTLSLFKSNLTSKM